MTFDILRASVRDMVEEMHRIRRLYILKETMRYDSERDMSVHSESVAEHLFGMQVLTQYFLPLEDPHFALDRYRINELILYHEIGEIETGDIPVIKKTEDHRVYEHGAARRVADSLPYSIKDLAWNRYAEFEESATPEAQFTVAIDKIEPMFEMLSERGYPLFKVQGYTRDIAIGRKIEATTQFPHMRKFVDAWTEHMDALDAFAL